MNHTLLHRISAIESEMVGEFDLREVATKQLPANQENAMPLPTCCEFHGKADGGCREGRDCPERALRASEAAQGGYECALPPIVADTLTPVRRWNWQAIGYWSAILAAIAFGLLIGTSHG